jgi:hypothetical protein
MQNKPNLLNTQMNVSNCLTDDYENKIVLRLQKNKPNQSQFYPPQADSNVTLSKWDITRICSGFFVAKWVGFGYNIFNA